MLVVAVDRKQGASSLRDRTANGPPRSRPSDSGWSAQFEVAHRPFPGQLRDEVEDPLEAVVVVDGAAFGASCWSRC